jgi:hypothetical protein
MSENNVFDRELKWIDLIPGMGKGEVKESYGEGEFNYDICGIL